MNQCFEFIAENDLQAAGLYSPTHSFPVEGLLHSVPANTTLSHNVCVCVCMCVCVCVYVCVCVCVCVFECVFYINTHAYIRIDGA